MKKRIDKDELKTLLKKGSLDEKLKVVVDDRINRLIYGKGIVSKKDLKDIFDSVDDDDVELMNNKIDAINKVIKTRKTYSLCAAKLDYLAEYINSGLERIDIYVREAYLLNALLDDIKPLQEKDAELYKTLFRRISLQKSIDKGIGFIYDKESNSYKVDASKMEKQLRIALDRFAFYLRDAKILTIALERFAKDNLIESLIPYDIKDRVEGFQLDYSRNKRFSGKNYRKLLADNSIESILQKALMEDNGDIEFIFPFYEDVEVDEVELAKLDLFK